MQFVLPMIPPTATAQCHQVNTRDARPRFYNPPSVMLARAKLEAALAPHRPPAPLEGPLRLTTKWCWPTSGKHQNGEYKATRPDTDNLIKLLKDVMSDLGFWRNDAQVASEITEKFWADVPGIFVQVDNIGG
jgi:Holliday junction resolvase RusA-like endonuclease